MKKTNNGAKIPKGYGDGRVVFPKLYLIVGIIDFALCTTLALFAFITKQPTWTFVVSLFMAFLGLSLIICYINCRIYYDENEFVVKNFFGIKRKYTYDQISGLKEDFQENSLFIDKRRIKVALFAKDGISFIELAKKRYRTLCNGRQIPKIKKTRFDIFNGNVYDAEGMLFAYVLVLVVCIGFLIFSVYHTYFSPYTSENTIEQTVTFVSYEFNEDEIVMMSSDNHIYKIQFIDEQFNSQNIKALCDGKQTVTAYSIEITPDDEDDFYSVKAILYNNTYLLSFDEANRLHRQEYTFLVVISLVFLLVWVGYIVGSVIVGRNPKKYSRRVIKFFFKDGYVKY